MTNLDKKELRQMCKDGMSFYQIRQAVNCSDATIKRYIEVFSLNNMNNQPKPTDNNPKVDESAVNKYMLSLGYKWEHYDAGIGYQWVKDGYKVSQLQAISMYTAIERPVDLQSDETRLIRELDSILGSFGNYWYCIGKGTDNDQSDISEAEAIEQILAWHNSNLRSFSEAEISWLESQKKERSKNENL